MHRSGPWVAWLALVSMTACGANEGDLQPFDLIERVPAPSALRVSMPGPDGAADSAREQVHKAVRKLSGRLSALGDLERFLDSGGKRDRNISLPIALESPPHVADQAVRYSQDNSRLDVERINDHVFYYLQIRGQDGKYDLDTQISDKYMLVDGGSVVPKIAGTRPPTTQTLGVSRQARGYLRVHFNRRAQDRNDVHDALQLDYDLEAPIGEQTEQRLQFIFFRRSDVPGADGQVLGVWWRRDADGGFVLQSEQKNNKPRWSWIAQYRKDGSLAVWAGDGKLRACYDGSGKELGNEADPLPCADFNRKFVAPPKLSAVWPGLPSGIPK